MPEQEVRAGAERWGVVPALASIFIYHRFPGKELHSREQPHAVQFTPALLGQTLLVIFSVPKALGNLILRLLRARSPKMKLVENTFCCYNGPRLKTSTHLFQVLSRAVVVGM